MRPGWATLALDLVEEFRAQITAQDLTQHEGGAVYLEGHARKIVVTALQERKQEEITHPLLNTKIPIGSLPQLQARFMARAIRGEMDSYIPFLVK